MTGGGLPETAKGSASTRSRLCSGRSWTGYALAAAATALAMLLRWVLVRAFGDLPVFITFFPAVALVAMLLGARAGALATILSVLAADLFFLPPHGFGIIVSLNHAVSLGLFTTAGLLVSFMAEMLNRARRRQAATERELLLRAMSEGMPDLLFLKDRDSRIIMANSAMVRAVGKPAEQIVGHTDEEYFDDPAVARAMMANDRRVMESGQPETMEEYLPGVEGGRTFLVVKTPWRDAEGRIIGVVVCARDVTERKRAEEALRESEGRFRAIFDHAALGIVEVDAQGRFIAANDRVRQILDYPREELLGKTTRELTYPEDWPVSDDLNARLFDGRLNHFDCEKRYLKRDGSPLWVHLTVSAFRDSAGRFVRAIGTVEDITERKRAEEVLLQSEARLRAFFEQAAVGTAVADPATGRFLQVNSQYCEITGYERSELLGMTFMDVTHPQDRFTDREKYDRLASGEAREYLAEKRYVRKDGRVIWVQVAVGMVRDAQGRAVQSAGVIQDITERKRGEEALRESEAGLAAAQRLAHIGSWEWDVANDTARWSEETFRIFGVDSDLLEHHQQAFVDMVHPEDRERVRKALADALSGTKEYDLDYRVLRADGTERVIHAQAEVLRGGGTEPVIMRGTVHDITERKRAETALQESERFVKSVAGSSPHCLYLFDLDTMGLSYENRPMLGDLGYGPEICATVRGLEAFRQFMPPEEMPHLARLLEEWLALGDGQVRDDEYRLRHADGSIHFFAGREIVFARHPDGSVRQVLGSLLDITDRKRVEVVLKELNETLEQRVAERTAVAEHRALQLRALAARLTQAEQKERQRLATILHDHLQQLLASTKFHLASFRRRVTDSQQSESLRQVDHLLDESLATSRGLMLDLSPPILQQGDMRQVLEWLAGWFGTKHGLAVDVQADEAADPQNHEIRVLLFEVVRELLFNVVKHGKVDRARVQLGLTSAGRIQVIVCDEGVGFDPSRPDRGEQDTSGFGLLSIRERLDWLGGQMEVASAPGEGTRVTLVLPRKLETQAAEPSAALATPAPARTAAPTLPSGVEGGKVRVLLADDHQVVRNGLAGILQMEPWIEVVGQASDGREAVEMALQMQPDVVIMDVSMPNMDGVEATRRIVSQRLGVKVIGLSMFDETGVVEAMRSAGAVSYLPKSAAPDALVAAIRDCTNRAAAEATAGAGL